MHINYLNGLFTLMALVVSGYFIVIFVRSAWTTARVSHFFLLLAEGVFTLILFGITDYPNNHSVVWWLVILWMTARAARLHYKLIYRPPTPEEPAYLPQPTTHIDFKA